MRLAAAAPADLLCGLRWRVLLHGLLPGADNMAIDHALAEAADAGEAGGGVLRLYRWREPTISLGRNEAARGRYDLDAAHARGVAFVRRPTGGRAVLHDREVTYAVIVPLRGVSGLRAAYLRINDALRAGLASLGVAARLADGPIRGGAPAPRGPCFAAPAPGELVVGEQKLVGSAQGRVGGALLQHGSVLLAGAQEQLLELGAGGAWRARPVTLAELLGEEPAWEAVADALIGGFRASLRGEWREAALAPVEVELARRHRARYASTEWTWRR